MALQTITQNGHVVTYDNVVIITPSTTVPGKYRISWKKPTMKKSGKSVNATYKYRMTLGYGVFNSDDASEYRDYDNYVKETSATYIDFDSIKEVYSTEKIQFEEPVELAGTVVQAEVEIWSKQTGWLNFASDKKPKSASKWLAPEIPELSAIAKPPVGSSTPTKILVRVCKPYPLDNALVDDLANVLDYIEVEYRKTTSKTWIKATTSNTVLSDVEGDTFDLAITPTSMVVGEYEVRSRARFSPTFYTVDYPTGAGITNPGYGLWTSVKFHAVKQFDNILAIVDDSSFLLNSSSASNDVAKEIAANRRYRFGDVSENATTQIIVAHGKKLKDLGSIIRSVKVNKSKTTLVYIHFGTNDILNATSLSTITPVKTATTYLTAAVSAYLAKDPGATVFVERLSPAFERSGKFLDYNSQTRVYEEYTPIWRAGIRGTNFLTGYQILYSPEFRNVPEMTLLSSLGAYFSSYNNSFEAELGHNNLKPNKFRSGTRQRVGFGSRTSQYYLLGDPEISRHESDRESQYGRWIMIRNVLSMVSYDTIRSRIYGTTFTYTNRGERLYRVAPVDMDQD
jgi:hypothetical protein